MTDDVGKHPSMTDTVHGDPPSPFIARWCAPLARLCGHGARALDVASGRGRHSLALAAQGFAVIASDIRCDSVAELARRARAAHLPVSAICADLTQFPIPRSTFDVIVVSRYLDRQLMPALLDALT